MELPYRTYGVNLARTSSDPAAVSLSMDTSGNLVFTDEYVKNVLNKPNGITLKDIYTRTKGVFSNSNGELFFKDSTISRPYSLKEIIDSCKNWKNNLLSGALWWMNSVETDHYPGANVPRKTDPNGITLRNWSVDRFFYNKLRTNTYSIGNSDEIITGDLFVNKLTAEWLWYDVPGLVMVLPPIPDQYKITQIISRLAYVTYNSPEPIAFRIYDCTNNIELARSAVVQCNPCEVAYPVVLSWQGQLSSPSTSPCTNIHESCGCTDISCTTGDSACDTPDSSSTVTVTQYAVGSRIIKIQFHVKNYQTDHWTRLFGMEIDGTYLAKSTIEAVIFDSNPQGKFGKKHSTVHFNNQNSLQVTFSSPLESSNYAISLSCNKNINCWWQNKSNIGFTIVSELPFTGYIDWAVTNLNASTTTA